MSKNPSYLERLLPASHTHIELASFLKEPNDSPQPKHHSELLENINKKLHQLNLFLKLQILQILTTIIKVFILTGQFTLFYFDRGMYAFRCTPRKKLLISFSTPIYNLLGTGLFPRKLALIMSVVMLTLTFMVAISAIYFWFMNKKEKFLASDQDLVKNNNNPVDEPMSELSYRTAAFLALLEQAKVNTDAQGNIPNELAVKLITARRDVISLSNDLYVVPELVLNGDENGLTPAQIHKIPIEKYEAGSMDDEEAETCSLCIKDFKEKEELRKLSCGHRFHKKCADDWLEKLNTCPNCKIELRVGEDIMMN